MPAKFFTATAAVTVAASVVLLGLAGPTQATSGTMYGDPVAVAKYWRYQQYWDDCVLMSSADVIGEVTGQQPSEEAIIDMAQSTPSAFPPGPIYTRPANPNDPNSGEGTWFRDIPTLLARYNIGTVVRHGSIEEVEQQLGAGHRVFASVNGELIWHQRVEEKGKNGHPTHDHAVVVTGVDTAAGVVHVNDSGSEDGRDEQIPIYLFTRSWDTSDDQMTVTS